eukprot:TRINITY_DN364_c0_g2_i1.p1 TRINITY_DN364_c0_g2~~TRINITY_DN364_c0_g2_i1.p1  ORF type:complete len:181 (-),score=71.83 TRINITY_DN364_c0_g2_i1:93-635(-)
MATSQANLAATNPRGIPRTNFVENVESFLSGTTVEVVMKNFQESYGKYKFMEIRLNQQKVNLNTKIPEIQSALDAVHFLKLKKDSEEPIKTSYELSDNLFANATINKPQSICIWLGANTMVEYSFEEALELLENNISTAKRGLSNVEEDLHFLRDQITITEVNIARVHNFSVQQRKKLKS